MPLLQITSPHAYGKNDTASVMRLVTLATLPGVAAMIVFFGWGVLSNLLIGTTFALIFEAMTLKIRKMPVTFYLRDYSAIVTAVLLCIALPPHSSWWLIAVGIFFSIVIAKQLYGGLGYNPFNPAMVGYVVLLISFPVEMTRWAAPSSGVALNFFDSFSVAFGLQVYPADIDGFTAATPLDIMRQNSSLMMSDLKESYSVFGNWGGVGWETVNGAFLIGGLFLLWRRIYTWHAPVSMLVTLFLLSAIFYDGGSSNSAGSPLFHLFSGGTMLGAWFIITDPVSSATSNKGRIIFGALIGALIFIIRKWGNYPDAVAFAVLLLNFAAPLIDHYTQPRTYGH